MSIHSARYYTKQEGNVKCILCPHGCVLTEGKTGICKTRFNKGNELFTKAWGNLCTLSIDPIEKKPLFHFLPGTKTLSMAIEGCTFRCLNCQNFSISQQGPDSYSMKNIEPGELVESAISHNCKSISYTYSEPVAFYEYMLETARLAKLKGIKNVMVSNGYINSEPLNELCRYLDAFNVDLKSFDNLMHRKLTGGQLEPVLNTLKTIKENNAWLEITNLIIPGWTDNPETIRQMANWLFDNGFSETPVHFSRFYPTYKLENENHTPVEVVLDAMKTAISAGLKYVYTGNMRGQDHENTCCPQCGKLLIKRNGFEVLENNLKNNKCKNCSAILSGIWE